MLSWFLKSDNEKKQHLEEKLGKVETYLEWKSIAEELDTLEGLDAWKEEEDSKLYDFKLVAKRLEALKDSLKKYNISSEGHTTLVRLIRSELRRNMGGMGSPELHAFTRVGTKKIIEDYTNTVLASLNTIFNDPSFDLSKKFEFFWSTRQAFGRSALLLSGGASFGVYHTGVVKALYTNNLLPRIMAGSSAGSVVAALVCTRTNSELEHLLGISSVNHGDPTFGISPGWNLDLNAFDDSFDATGSAWRKINRLFTSGVLMDINKLQDFMKRALGDVTFIDAYEKSRRILNITVSSTNSFEVPRLLNYLTSPNVLVWSACSASCALSLLYEPVELLCKDPDTGEFRPYHSSPVHWTDGSVQADLPISRLTELYNVNHFVVSQVNPHVIPFISNTRDAAKKDSSWLSLNYIKRFVASEVHHRVKQAANMGLLPRFLNVITSVLSQTYEGDITLVPALPLSAYSKLLSNPTREWIKKATIESERSVWEQMSLIKNHCAIEIALDEIVQNLRKVINHPLRVSSSFY